MESPTPPEDSEKSEPPPSSPPEPEPAAEPHTAAENPSPEVSDAEPRAIAKSEPKILIKPVAKSEPKILVKPVAKSEPKILVKPVAKSEPEILLKPVAKSEPERLEKYTPIRRLGQGRTSEVTLAYSPEPGDPDRVIALKRAQEAWHDLPAASAMFAHEAKLLARFHHPNVVRVFEHGQDGAGPFLALEYLNGLSLAELLNAAVEREVTLPIGVVCRLGVHALAALEHVHSLTDLDGEPLGIVHGDVSPYNLLVGYNGDVKLLDFGFAQAIDAAQTFSAGGQLAYAAPETLEPGTIDARADLFSLGAVLWELIARVRLFKRGTDEHTRDAIRSGHVPSLIARSRCPEELDELLKRALARSPADRFPSAASMRDALLQFLADQSELLEDNAIASFMTELLGQKRRELERERELSARIDADSEPPTLLRTPLPLEPEPLAAALEPAVPRIAQPAPPASPAPSANAVAAHTLTPAPTPEERAPTGALRRSPLLVLIVVAVAVAILLFVTLR